jgi:pimeloyl-ACP methyl ester carboxylesterase
MMVRPHRIIPRSAFLSRFSIVIVVVVLLVAAVPAFGLERGDPADEGLTGVEVALDFVETSRGHKLRTILTRPPGAKQKLPAILFVQDLTCDPVTLPAAGGDGLVRMMRTLMESSGIVFARTEKAGIGDSKGISCDKLDYEMELEGHQAALTALRKSPFVDKDNIFIFGVGMGGTMAPLLARTTEVRGVIVWGTTSHPWAEHMILLDRRVLELRDVKPAKVDEYMRDHIRFHTKYLIEGMTPDEIFKPDPDLRRAWGNMVGTSARTHYGRPFSYHHQAASRNWERAWEDVNLPVLVVHGQYDWMMSAAEHRRIARIVNQYTKKTATFVMVPETGYAVDVYPSASAAFEPKKPGAYNAGVADVVIDWVNHQVKR